MATPASYVLLSVLLITILFPHLVHSNLHQNAPYTTSLLSSSNIKKIADGDTLVGVQTFLTLFIWKDRILTNITTSDSFFSDWRDQLRNSSSNDLIFTRNNFIQLLMKKKLEKGQATQAFTISIGIENQNLNPFLDMLKFYNLTSDTFTFRIHKTWVWSETCRIGNIFEQHDAVLMDPYDFAFYLRTYRDRTENASQSSYINTYDFIPIPLIPNALVVKSAKNSWQDNTNFLQNQTMTLMFEYKDMNCQNADVADAQILRFLTGYSNFTQQDAELIQSLSKKTISYDCRVYNNYVPLFLTCHNLTSSKWDLNVVTNSLYPSTCHPCGTDTLCLSRNFRVETDSGIFPQFIIVILYFILLFATGSYKIPAFKRRLLVPYTPVLLFFVFLMFCNFLVRLCSPLFHFVSLVIYTWFFLIYFLSVVRFYYLRNLYSSFPNQETRSCSKF